MRLPLMRRRRFSDAGITEPSARSGGRRPKSAKARNRVLGRAAATRALWGFRHGLRLRCGALSDQRAMRFGRSGAARVKRHRGRRAFCAMKLCVFELSSRELLVLRGKAEGCRRSTNTNDERRCTCGPMCWRHEVSTLIFSDSGVGRCFGC